MDALFLILLFLGAVAFLIEALGWNGSKYNLMAGGLFLWILVSVIAFTDKFV